VPPFTGGFAVKVTEVPSQTGFADSYMVTEGVTEGLTVMVIILLVVGPGQGVSKVVTTKVILSAFASVVEVKVKPVSPEIGALFLNH